MRTLLPVSLVLAALASETTAQVFEDPTKLQPILSPVRHAPGVYLWDTQQWVPSHPGSRYTVFRNDCSWIGGSSFFSTLSCETVVDEGRIPSALTPLSSLKGGHRSLSSPTDDQLINSFQFGYCTSVETGFVDLSIGFYNNLRGDCAGFSPVQPPPLPSQAVPYRGATAYFDFGASANFPLPGSTIGGITACWVVTIGFSNNGGFCLSSEGDGKWDNDQFVDKFSWSFSHNMPHSVLAGPIVAGEPLTGGFGAGAFNVPAGTDTITGDPCGTGFGTCFDGFWLNVDSLPGSCPRCPEAAQHCTNCYWLGGWPASPLASFRMKLDALGDCNSTFNMQPTNYCTSGVSAFGCEAKISVSGVSSATAAKGFYVTCRNMPGQTSGLAFYGTNGGQATAWGNGTSFQCVIPPVRRMTVGQTRSTPGSCYGIYRRDLNARWTAKPTHNPGAGAIVNGQCWYRDPQNTSNQTTSLSDAIEWIVAP